MASCFYSLHVLVATPAGSAHTLECSSPHRQLRCAVCTCSSPHRQGACARSRACRRLGRERVRARVLVAIPAAAVCSLHVLVATPAGSVCTLECSSPHRQEARASCKSWSPCRQGACARSRARRHTGSVRARAAGACRHAGKERVHARTYVAIPAASVCTLECSSPHRQRACASRNRSSPCRSLLHRLNVDHRSWPLGPFSLAVGRILGTR